jgi:hypothetical protein
MGTEYVWFWNDFGFQMFTVYRGNRMVPLVQSLNNCGLGCLAANVNVFSLIQ